MRGRRALEVVVAVIAAIGATAGEARAQVTDGPAPMPHHVTVSGGVVWTGGYDIGDVTARLRGNAVGASAPPFTLFAAQSSVDAAAGVDVRVGFAVTRGLTVEFGTSYQRPGITTKLSQDAEAGAVTLDAEQLSQYVFDLATIWQLPRLHVGRRGRPFVLAGGGYLRQLYQDKTLVEEGSVYYAGGGVRYYLRGGDGGNRAAGLRGDARVQWRLDGVEYEGRTRVAPVLTVHAFFEF